MDFKKLKDCLGSYIIDETLRIQEARRVMDTIAAEDISEKRLLVVMGNILKIFEVSEYFKTVMDDIFVNQDFFSDKSVHQTNKTQRLKEIMEKNNFVERNRQFNLSVLQTYMENILSKQLLEINIKIEENQRMLENLGNASQEKKISTQEAPRLTKYLIVENERIRHAVRYDTIIELLRFGKRTADKFLIEQVIPYNSLIGLNRRNVIKKVIDYNIPKNQPLYNTSYKLNNTVDKQSAIIVRRENRLNILFVDTILHAEPVEAQDLGDSIQTFEGHIRVIEV